MKNYLTKQYTTGQEALIEKHGDAIWESVSELGIDTFTINDVLEATEYLKQFAPSTQKTLCRIVLLNVALQPDYPPIKRLSHTRWMFISY